MSGRVDGPLLDPSRDAARIRAFFVDPAHSRQGLGHALFVACHDAARAHGFTRLELAATLTGVRLYAREGFQPLERIEIALPDGLRFPVLRMVRAIAPGEALRPTREPSQCAPEGAPPGRFFFTSKRIKGTKTAVMTARVSMIRT